jgi:hypothetical protein
MALAEILPFISEFRPELKGGSALAEILQLATLVFWPHFQSHSLLAPVKIEKI